MFKYIAISTLFVYVTSLAIFGLLAAVYGQLWMIVIVSVLIGVGMTFIVVSIIFHIIIHVTVCINKIKNYIVDIRKLKNINDDNIPSHI